MGGPCTQLENILSLPRALILSDYWSNMKLYHMHIEFRCDYYDCRIVIMVVITVNDNVLHCVSSFYDDLTYSRQN